MRAVLVFVLLFATVLCRPARRFSTSSSESSEEVRRPIRFIRKQAALVPQTRAAPVPVQNVVAADATASDESAESSEDKAVVEAPFEVKADSPDTTSASDTVSDNSQDSNDDDDDDDDETEESETEEEEESSNSSESGESSTPFPATVVPVVVTDEPVIDATEEPVTPTIVIDPGRGDNLGGYPSDYKSIIYVEDKSYHKMPSPYKSYEFAGAGKKTAYDMTDGNEVEKTMKVYKALQVHTDLLEEDTSTPDVESQGLDTSSDTSQDQEPSLRQASFPEEEDSTSDTTSKSEKSSTPEEEDSASTASESASASLEAEDEESESSEEATATPGAADSDSDETESTESSSEEQGMGPDTTTDMPLVITAK